MPLVGPSSYLKGSRGGVGEGTTQHPLPPSPPPTIVMPTSRATIQFYMGLTALVVSALSFARLPEVLEYLYRRWQSCRTIDSALVWVPIVVEKLIPSLLDYFRIFLERPSQEEEQKSRALRLNIQKLEEASLRYTLLTRAGRLDAEVLRRCLVLLRFLEIRDRRHKSFIPWRPFEGRKELVNEVKIELTKVNGAYSVSTDAPAQWNRGISLDADLRDRSTRAAQ